MIFVVLLIVYFLLGIAMVIWDFRPNNTLHDPPSFIQDRSISTAIKFVLFWPYKLLNR
jgi:hypothetical protein